MAEPFRRPLGLALSGGGALGAWQTGVLEVLRESGVRADSVLGFSAGALNATAWALDLLPEARRRWEMLHGASLLPRPRLSPFSLFSDRILRDAAALAGGDDSARRRCECPFIVVSAARDRRSLHYARFEPGDGGAWDAPLEDHLAASCAIPMVFPPVRLRHRGRELLLQDGGVPCEEPLSLRPLGPCRDVLIVEVVGPDCAPPPSRRFLTALDARSRKTLRRLMDQGAASLRGRGSEPRVYRLSPSRPLAPLMLDFRRDGVLGLLRQGRADARAFLKAPRAHLAAAG